MIMVKNSERGATLVMVMIFLVLMSFFATSAFNSTNGNLRIVGNAQYRQEAIAAAQAAIEKTLSSALFSTSPDSVAASPFPIDIDGDGNTNYSVTLTPQPKCYRAKTIKTNALNPTIAADLSCMNDSGVQNSGLDSPSATAGAGDSLCANTEWNIRAQVIDAGTNAKVAVNQGASLRVLAADASNYCQ